MTDQVRSDAIWPDQFKARIDAMHASVPRAGAPNADLWDTILASRTDGKGNSMSAMTSQYPVVPISHRHAEKLAMPIPIDRGGRSWVRPLAAILVMALMTAMFAMLNRPGDEPEYQRAAMVPSPSPVEATCDVEPITVDEVMERVVDPGMWYSMKLLRGASLPTLERDGLTWMTPQRQVSAELVSPADQPSAEVLTAQTYLACVKSGTLGQVWSLTEPYTMRNQMIWAKLPMPVASDDSSTIAALADVLGKPAIEVLWPELAEVIDRLQVPEAGEVLQFRSDKWSVTSVSIDEQGGNGVPVRHVGWETPITVNEPTKPAPIFVLNLPEHGQMLVSLYVYDPARDGGTQAAPSPVAAHACSVESLSTDAAVEMAKSPAQWLNAGAPQALALKTYDTSQGFTILQAHSMQPVAPYNSQVDDVLTVAQTWLDCSMTGKFGQRWAVSDPFAVQADIARYGGTWTSDAELQERVSALIGENVVDHLAEWDRILLTQLSLQTEGFGNQPALMVTEDVRMSIVPVVAEDSLGERVTLDGEVDRWMRARSDVGAIKVVQYPGQDAPLVNMYVDTVTFRESSPTATTTGPSIESIDALEAATPTP